RVDFAEFIHGTSAMVIVDRDGFVRLWDFRANTEKILLQETGGQPAVTALSRDQQYLVVAFDNSSAHLIELQSGKVTKLTGHTGTITALKFLLDDRRVVSASQDGTLRIWNIKTVAPPLLLRADSTPITYVDVSLDGKKLLAVHEKTRLVLWSLDSLQG